MADKPRLGAHAALYLKPLLYGLERSESPFSVFIDLPAVVALKFSERPGELQGAFLSPIDYARHGGQYHIVPGICVSSSSPTSAIQLFIKQDRSNITTIAVDIRVTSEIILAKIVLTECFPNLPSDPRTLQFLPMLPDVDVMLKKADAALIINDSPVARPDPGIFSLDLVEEWNDLTGLPYVHGFWTARAEHLSTEELRALLAAKEQGASNLGLLSARLAPQFGISEETCLQYLTSFSYDMRGDEEASLTEFFRYSFYHGTIRDLPELNFFSLA